MMKHQSTSPSLHPPPPPPHAHPFQALQALLKPFHPGGEPFSALAVADVEVSSNTSYIYEGKDRLAVLTGVCVPGLVSNFVL